MADVTRDPEAWARLGAKIRERRESMGLSRRQLSEQAGVSEKSIQVAEEGRTPRARWPQSLRLIETGLGWQPGSMLQILEGAEPESLLDLFSLAEEDEATKRTHAAPLFPAEVVEEALPLEIKMRPTAYTRSRALASLPKAFRESLKDVLQFGARARDFGADPHLVEEYERAVEHLLLDLIGRSPLSYQGSEEPGHLHTWSTATRMDPFLRKAREDRARGLDRERMRLMDSPFRFTVGPNVSESLDSSEVIREMRKLAREVARLAAKVDEPARDGVNGESEESGDAQHPEGS